MTSVKKLMELGRKYKVDHEEDFIVAVKTFVEEAKLIDRMDGTAAASVSGELPFPLAELFPFPAGVKLVEE